MVLSKLCKLDSIVKGVLLVPGVLVFATSVSSVSGSRVDGPLVVDIPNFSITRGNAF